MPLIEYEPSNTFVSKSLDAAGSRRESTAKIAKFDWVSNFNSLGVAVQSLESAPHAAAVRVCRLSARELPAIQAAGRSLPRRSSCSGARFSRSGEGERERERAAGPRACRALRVKPARTRLPHGRKQAAGAQQCRARDDLDGSRGHAARDDRWPRPSARDDDRWPLLRLGEHMPAAPLVARIYVANATRISQ
jgi:hypothetical protein